MINKIKQSGFFDWYGFRFSSFLIKEFTRNKCSETAAFLTYTTLLSFVPMLAIIVMVLSSIPMLEPAREHFYTYLYNDLMPGTSGEKVKIYLTEFIEKSASVGLVGGIALFYTSMAMLLKIEMSFNEIWEGVILKEQGDRKPTLKENIRSLVITLIRFSSIIIFVPIILGLAFTFSGAIQGLGKIDFGSVFAFFGMTVSFDIDLSFINSTVGIIVTQVLSFILTSVGFGIMYWFIPRVNVSFRYACMAGVVTAILFIIIKLGFTALMKSFTSYSSIYGAFAALPSFMIWLNLSWIVILMGVQITHCLTVFEKDTIT